MVWTNCRHTLKDVTRKFYNAVFCRTVRRRLFENNYKRYVVSKRITIGKVNRSHRVSYCRQKLYWNVQDNRSKVIFSDKTKVVIDQDKKICVWRKSNERLMGECTGMRLDRERQGLVSAMFWGCITYNGVGTFSSINGNMNSEVYIETLIDNL